MARGRAGSGRGQRRVDQPGLWLLLLVVALILVREGHLADAATSVGQWVNGRRDQPSPTAPSPRAALQQLNSLPVKGRASMSGYSRSQFGAAWTDVNRNGCDQRNDRIKVDVTLPTFKAGTRNCVVLTGDLLDPYSGQKSTYRRGAGTHEMDHVVALANMWVTGAQGQTLQRRTEMANDLNTLQLTSRHNNQAKKAGDAATWLPPNRAYRCTYVSRQIDIKARWGLWVTPAEKQTMTRVLSHC